MDFRNQQEHFSLRWNNFNDNMKSGFHDLLRTEDFVDVTIAAEGQLIQAHKMVLSVCSPYFKNIFKTNPCQHPVVFLKDVTHKELSDILQFMYLGEVSIQQEDLGNFLKMAEALQIKGLTHSNSKQDGSVAEPHMEKPKDSETKKTKLFISYDLNSEDVCSKKIKLSPRNDVVQTDSQIIVQNSVDSVLKNNDGYDEGDIGGNDNCSDDNREFLIKSEASDLEISDVESDIISVKDGSMNISDSLTKDNKNSKESDTHSLGLGLSENFSNGIQELLNEPFVITDGSQGPGCFPRLTKNQGRCPICGRVLQHKKNLQTHIADQHSGMLGSWPCKICHKVCKTWSALRVHTNRHHAKVSGQSRTGVPVFPSSE